MSRFEGVQDNEAGPLTRLLFWFTKRALGPKYLDIHSAVGRKAQVTEEQLRDITQFEAHFDEREKTVPRLATALTLTPADVSDNETGGGLSPQAN